MRMLPRNASRPLTSALKPSYGGLVCAALNEDVTVDDAAPVASTYGVPRVRTRLARHRRERGLLSVAGSCARWSIDYVAGLPWPFASAESHFTFDSRRLPYLYARHNRTWFNERSVE